MDDGGGERNKRVDLGEETVVCEEMGMNACLVEFFGGREIEIKQGG